MCKLVLVLGVLCAAMVAESSSQRGQFIHPTYRPPPQRPVIIRTAREAPLWLYQDPDIPRAPASSDHPFLPSIIDDIKLDPNTRTARSLPPLEPWRPTPFNPRVPLPDFPTPRTRFPTYARIARDVEDVEELDGDELSRVARSLSTPRASRGGGQGRSGSRDTGPTHPGYNRRNARNAPRFPRPTPFNPRAPNPFPRPDRRSPFPILARNGRDTEHVQFDSQDEFLNGVVDG